MRAIADDERTSPYRFSDFFAWFSIFIGTNMALWLRTGGQPAPLTESYPSARKMIRLGAPPWERSVSYVLLAVLSVALVRLGLICVYPRRTLAGDDPDANSVE